MQVSETANTDISDTQLQYINDTTLKQYDVNFVHLIQLTLKFAFEVIG
jgi:hypothetical protein